MAVDSTVTRPSQPESPYADGIGSASLSARSSTEDAGLRAAVAGCKGASDRRTAVLQEPSRRYGQPPSRRRGGSGADDAEVVRDEHHRQSGSRLQRDEEIEDLSLRHDVERGDRLVAISRDAARKQGPARWRRADAGPRIRWRDGARGALLASRRARSAPPAVAASPRGSCPFAGVTVARARDSAERLQRDTQTRSDPGPARHQA